VYHERIAISGLHYIAYGLGLFVGTQLGTRLSDRIYRKLKQRNRGQDRAEHRLPLLMSFSLLSPASLILYGWTINPKIHWIVPTIGAFFFGVGYIVPTQCTIAYTLECYGKHSASASAATNVFRNIAGFAFPLFGPLLYKKLGWGWGNSLLALVLLMSAVPTTLVLWWFGARLRARSKHASGDEDDEVVVAVVPVGEVVVQKA
jgi:MFS family permease